jgi:hypothetical protein
MWVLDPSMLVPAVPRNQALETGASPRWCRATSLRVRRADGISCELRFWGRFFGIATFAGRFKSRCSC